jgi:hypothetical protein
MDTDAGQAVRAEEVTWAALTALREARQEVEALGATGWYAAGLAGSLATAVVEAEHAHRVASRAVAGSDYSWDGMAVR